MRYVPATSMWQVGWNSFFLVPNFHPVLEDMFDFWEWQQGFRAAYHHVHLPDWMLE